ncbi:cytochrome c oxidase assembly protein subunit 11 [Constrictibacter sp. MBR-5]|jgi:cytochrome c oxidase assembly protein subunit 11|uniref:cytochrome c oxidase assembly protein n=1 Tax=Constrictibacter sp. MBR-5 TaxID=3156467 RepID=UPI0033912E5D
MSAPESRRPIDSRNARVALPLVAIVAGMGMMAYASVPLYQLFCQVTGYGGTTQVAEATDGRVLDREMVIRFNADVNPALPWAFRPEQHEVRVKVGEQGLAFYRAENRSSRPIVGTAVYNVTPQKAGLYFSKIQCFCFTEQRLEPGESIDMPVTFFVDPAIAEDRNLDDVGTITLSYTFYPAPDAGQPKPDRPGARTASVVAGNGGG